MVRSTGNLSSLSKVSIAKSDHSELLHLADEKLLDLTRTVIFIYALEIVSNKKKHRTFNQ